MDRTNDSCIGVQFNSSFSDGDSLADYAHELQKYNIVLATRDLKGVIMNAALDFVDYDLISLGYELLRTIMLSGCYDIIKSLIIRMWNSIRPHNSNIPFTIKITGIPTENGRENISCKIKGNLTSKQKEEILEKTFDLANNISNNTFKLKEKSMFYDAFNAHIFQVDSNNISLSEVDVEKEIRKKTSK